MFSVFPVHFTPITLVFNVIFLFYLLTGSENDRIKQLLQLMQTGEATTTKGKLVQCIMGGTDYYLVCADSPSYTLEKETTDDCGIILQFGTSVNPLKNKMIKKHMTLVPSMSAVYIVETTVKSKISFTMPEDEHLKILEIVSEIDI